MRTLHVVLDGSDAPREASLALMRAEAGQGSSVHVLADRAPDGVEAALRVHEITLDGRPGAENDEAAVLTRNVQAMARAAQIRDEVDLVVAHGWLAAPCAERIAARRGVPLVVAAQLGLRADGAQPCAPALEAWAAPIAERIVVEDEAARASLVARTSVDGSKVVVLELDAPSADLGERAVAILREAVERRSSAVRPGRIAPRRAIYDVGVRCDGAPWSLVEELFLRFGRTVVVKDPTEAEWARTCARCRVMVVPASGAAPVRLAQLAFAEGCLPVLVHGGTEKPRLPGVEHLVSTSEVELVPTIVRWLEDPGALDRAVRLARSSSLPATPVEPPPPAPQAARPLRLVLNHGGVVAQELAASVAAFGWDLKPLLGAGDPLAGADALIVLPYGGPQGALQAARRATRAGVPVVFWHVEDPRYFFHPEYGPAVRALALESALTFSTTLQLPAEYRALGVEVRYLPMYGRGHLLVETPRDEDRRSIDLLFLGSKTPDRERFVDALRAELGPGVSFVARSDVDDPDERRELVASARLGLSYGTMTDASRPDGAVVRSEGTTERVFDYPLAGTPVLHDRRGHLRDSFTDGEDVFVLTDEAGAAAQVRALLADPQLRARVAARARASVLGRHLGRHRMLTIAEALVGRGAISSPAVRASIEEARRLDAGQEKGGRS